MGTFLSSFGLITHTKRYLKAGDTFDVFLDDFPSVTREQAVAYLEMSVEAFEYALREREASPGERDAHAAR